MVASTFSGPTLAPPISDTTETTTDPEHQSRVDALDLQVLEQAGDFLGQVGQPPQQADHDAGRRSNCHPPPVPAEPARTGVGVPPAPELDDPERNQAGERPDRPEGGRIAHEHPELPLLE